MSELRSTAERRADARSRLEQQGDAWLATASQSGIPRMIVVATAWDGTDLVVATRAGTPTAENLDATGRATAALGTSDDVVMLELDVAATCPATADAEPAAFFREAAGWDPAEQPGTWRFFRLRPRSIQAYRGYGELAGRHVMRDGRWLA